MGFRQLPASYVVDGAFSGDYEIDGLFVVGDPGGARAELGTNGLGESGLRLYAGDGVTKTVELDAATGNVTIIGELMSGTSGRRLVVNPSGSTVPALRFYPSTGDEYSEIYSTDGAFPDEVTMFVETGQNNAGTAHSMVTIAAGLLRLQIYDAGNYNPGGGFLDVAEGYTQIGFSEGGISANYFWFGNDGITRHVGEWDYFDIAQSGLIMGQQQFVGTLGTAGATLSYGFTFSDAPFPLAILNDTPAAGQYGCGLNIYARNASGFSFRGTKDSNGDYAVIFWAFRM